MTALLKDRYKVGLTLATLFCISMMASIYTVYNIPHNLNLADGYQSALMNVYLVLAATFLLGVATVWLSLNYRNEVIVYREKQKTDEASNANADSSKTTISLEPVKANLEQSKIQKEILTLGLQAVCKQLDAGQGALYIIAEREGHKKIELRTGYALAIAESTVLTYEVGEGLIGQSAAHGRTLYIDDVPEGYIKIISGLGSASPRYVLIVPMKMEAQVIGVIEIASFAPINEDERKFVEESAQLIAKKITGSRA